MSLINLYTEPIYLYTTSSVIYFCGLVIAYPSRLYVRRSINVLESVFVFSFAISLVNGLLLQRWLNRNSHIMFLYPFPLFLSLVLNHHLQRQQLKSAECFNADERHLKLNKQGTPG